MDIKNFTNEELIQLFKEKECNLKRIESEFGLGKNTAGRLYTKRGIDYNSIKKEWLQQLRIDYENNPKVCKQCGKPLSNSSRKYCNNYCKNEYEYKQYIERWKQGLENGTIGKYDISNYIRRYLFEKYNNSCQECGWNKVNPKSGKVPLQIHHIDGNCLNNKEENLQLLCPNCHSLTDTFGNLNNDSSRIYRKQKGNI